MVSETTPTPSSEVKTESKVELPALKTDEEILSLKKEIAKKYVEKLKAAKDSSLVGQFI